MSSTGSLSILSLFQLVQTASYHTDGCEDRMGFNGSLSQMCAGKIILHKQFKTKCNFTFDN